MIDLNKALITRRQALIGLGGVGAGILLAGQTGLRFPSVGPEKLSEDFALALARGEISGHRVIHKFGANDAVGTSFVPICEGGIYRTPTAAVTLEAISGSSNDTAAGSGAQQITLIGLDSTWTEVTETVEMAGDSASAATSTAFIRLYRAYISRAGAYATTAGGSQAGDITIRQSGAGATWATISDTDFDKGQTRIGAYTIADKRLGIIPSLFVHVDSNKSVDILMMQRPNADDVVAPFTGALRTVFSVVGVAGTTLLKPRTPGGPGAGPLDFITFAKVASGTASVSVEFEVIEIETD